MKQFGLFLFIAVLLPFQLFALTLDDDLAYRANIGREEEIAALIKDGASPNAKDERGWNAISLAASRTDSEALGVVRALVQGGANINVRDPEGHTPLMNAIANTNIPMVKMLISLGADVNAITKENTTVRYMAEWYGNPQIIKLIDEAIKDEANQIKSGMSRRRMYNMLDQFIYYSCAFQYFNHNKQVGFYPKDQIPDIDKGIEKTKDVIVNVQTELMYNFKMPSADIEKIAVSVRDEVYKQLGEMISNRNRREKGVGTKQDLAERCQTVLRAWQASFDDYERQALKDKKPAKKAK